MRLTRQLSSDVNDHVYQAENINHPSEKLVVRFLPEDTLDIGCKIVDSLACLEGIVPRFRRKIFSDFLFIQGKFKVGYVFDFVEGVPLSEYCAEGLPELEVVRLIGELLQISKFFHEQNYLLADIKPDNFIVRQDRKLVYVDVDSILPCGSTVYFPGSQGYTAPELRDGHAAPSADIFSIGRTALFALSGQHPSTFSNDQGVISCSLLVSPLLKNFIDRLISLNPIDRPDLESALAYCQSLPARIERWRLARRYRKPVLISSAVLLLAGLVASVPLLKASYSFWLSAKGNEIQLQGGDGTSYYQRAIDHNNENIPAYIGLAIATSGTDIEQATSILRDVLIIDPDSDEVRYNLGVLLEDQGLIEEAIESYESVELNPEDETTPYYRSRNNLSRLLILTGEYDKAVSILSKAITDYSLINDRIDTTTLSYLYKNKGWAYFHLGALDKSEAALMASVELNAGLADSYCILAKLGRDIASYSQESLLTTCLQLGPSSDINYSILDLLP